MMQPKTCSEMNDIRQIRNWLMQELDTRFRLNFYNDNSIVKVTLDSGGGPFFYDVRGSMPHKITHRLTLF